MVKYEELVKQIHVLPMQFNPLAPLKLELTFQVVYICL
jgi:hypothetical protein